MDVFALIVVVGLAGLALALLLIGAFHPRSGAEVLDWHPTRSPEVEAELELEDVAQMLEAQNERRRRRGERELTEEEIGLRVAEDLRESVARSEAYTADADLAGLLEAANARRRRRGERELTAEELRAQVARGGDDGGAAS